MKQTMTNQDIANELLNDDNARWTRLGAHALADWLEEYEESSDEEIEFDRVAIRCDYNEDTAQELMDNYGEPGQSLEEVIAYVEDNTCLITVDNDPPTYLYQAF